MQKSLPETKKIAREVNFEVLQERGKISSVRGGDIVLG
jgi:hypothetical protein